MIVLETSWEVCNKMGGIYTVLSSRANEMMNSHKGQVLFVGPLLADTLPQDFIQETPELLLPWVEQAQQNFPLRTVVGRWDIPGKPPVILVDFTPLWEEKGSIYFEMWESFQIESDKGYGDYDESSLFSVAATRVMHSVLDSLKVRKGQAIAIYNEWQTAMGLLYSKRHRPDLDTLFITHATTVGRSIAGNGKNLYEYMPYYNGYQMAEELGVVAKHAVEYKAAHVSDLFGTVSRLTADECTQLLERTPLILPNGFEGGFVPQGRKYNSTRKEARTRLAAIAQALTGISAGDKDIYISLSGRYEYRNKGIDLYVDSIARLRNIYKGKKHIFAFILVPAWASEPRADLQYLLQHPEEQTTGLQHPTLTHWLHNMNEDNAQQHFHHLGLNTTHESVNIIHIPVYLTGHDGIVDLSYYDLLCGMDLSVYPSYYEPWGYTPLESIAFGVPTITTRYAGFGLWAEDTLGDSQSIENLPVTVLARTDNNGAETAQQIAEYIALFAQGKKGKTKDLKEAAQALAEQAEWKHFYKYYLDAYKSLKRKKLS